MSSEDFKRAIRAGKLSEALLLAIAQAPELKITTWIASPDTDMEKLHPDNSLQTQINLVAGEINNLVGEEMISGRHPEIERLHFQEVKRARNTIRANLTTIQKILHSLAAFQESSQLSRAQPAAAIAAEENSDTESAIPPDEVVVFAEDTTVESVPSQSDNDGEPRAEAEAETATARTIAPSTSNEEDWGDWLEEDSTIEANRAEDAEDWQ